MRLLVDTHCFLWMQVSPERLTPEALDSILDTGNELLMSAASAWEIVIKAALGKLLLPLPPEHYVPSRMQSTGIAPLPVQVSHALRVASLPTHHRDPFDRMLVAQAQQENLVLLTADRQLAPYDIPILWT